MGIVKTGRRVGRAVGRVVDSEDRQLLGQGVVLVGGAGIIVVAAAGILGFAIRVFQLALG